MSEMQSPNIYVSAINDLAELCWQIAENHGFHKEWNDGEKIALMHSELSEQLEAIRHVPKGTLCDYDEHCPEFRNDEIEMADLIIRALDFSRQRRYQIGQAILAKCNFNQTRPHLHGKQF